MVSNDVGIGTLPYVLKSTADNFSSGLMYGFGEMVAKTQNLLLEKSHSVTDYSEKDVLTGAKIKRPVLNSYILSRKEIEFEDKRLTLEFYDKNNRQPNVEENKFIRQQAIDNLNAKRSYNLEDTMNLFLFNIVSYKHKEMNYDIITLAKNALFSKKKESIESQSGEQMKNVLDENENMHGLDKLKDLVDFNYDNWLGISTKKSFGVSKEKSYNHQDKSTLNSLIHQQDNLKKKFDNKQIEKAEYEALNNAIEEQIEKLGGHLAMSKAGDAILQYVQLKGMALNPIAGTVNLLVGWMENSIKAADGRYYSTEQLFS